MKASEWDEIFIKYDEDYTTWIEIDQRNIPGSIRVLKKPISISSTIEQLFHPIRQKSAVIWTSGTLTVPNNERFIAKQLGIKRMYP